MDQVLEHFEETGGKRNGTIFARKRRVFTLENRDDDAAFTRERGPPHEKTTLRKVRIACCHHG